MLTKGVVVYHFKRRLYAVDSVQKISFSDRDVSGSVDLSLLFQSLTAIPFEWKRIMTIKPTYQLIFLFIVHLFRIVGCWFFSFENTCSFKTNLTNHQQISVAIDGG